MKIFFGILTILVILTLIIVFIICFKTVQEEKIPYPCPPCTKKFSKDDSYINNTDSTIVGFVNSVTILGDDSLMQLIIRTEEGDTPVIRKTKSDGKIDKSYGNNGIYETSTLGYLVIKKQSDQKILISGSDNDTDKSVVSRINTNGTIDESFGDQGVNILEDDSKAIDTIESNINSNQLISMILFNTALNSVTLLGLKRKNGSSDDNFGTISGSFIVTFPADIEAFFQLAQQSTGKILLVAHITTGIYIQRINVNGKGIDNTFGTSGSVLITNNFVNSGSITIAVQKDDKFVFQEFTYVDKIVLNIYRRNKDGSADNTFPNNGVVTLSDLFVDILNQPQTTGIIVLPNQEIIASGFFESEAEYIIRISPNGEILDAILTPMESIEKHSNVLSTLVANSQCQPIVSNSRQDIIDPDIVYAFKYSCTENVL